MISLQGRLKHLPKSRVELHIHLFSSARHETLWEVARQKGVPVPGGGSLEDLRAALQVHQPKNLVNFLKALDIILPILIGDLAAVERVAYELVEDQARENVAYCEVRFTPQQLVPRLQPLLIRSKKTKEEGEDNVTADDILKAALKGFSKGEEEFGTKMKVILSCLRDFPEWSWDVLRMCEEYRDAGVVGIDLCGPEGHGIEDASLVRNPVTVEVFQAARQKGIHRVIHSGEDGPASCVRVAVELLGAERLGHGYRVLEDEELYQMCLKRNIHFEVCPHSSYLTGAMRSLRTPDQRHPILRFAEDEASFSISSDDQAITNTRLSHEYRLVTRLGLNESHIIRANFQAALRSFLPAKEKRELLAQLREAYGVLGCAHSAHTLN